MFAKRPTTNGNGAPDSPSPVPNGMSWKGDNNKDFDAVVAKVESL